MDRGRSDTKSDTPHPDPRLHPRDYPMVHSNDTISDTDLTSYLTAGNESESIDADHPDHVGGRLSPMAGCADIRVLNGMICIVIWHT